MIGQTVSHYKILDKLGEGGMGVVYKGVDVKLDRPVAVKFLSGHLSADENSKARFLQEAKVVAALNHPNILSMYEIDEQDGNLFFVMEYVEGRTLQSYIADLKTGAGIPLEQAFEWTTAIAQGLKSAHEKQVVHRDIKPENIMLTNEGGLKIMDFGIAQLKSSSGLTRTGTSMGTLSYMSPEQAQGIATDQRCDVWSLGVVLFEMLTGERPFRAEHDAGLLYLIVNENPPLPSQMDKKIARPIDAVVMKMMAKDRNNRYDGMQEVIQALTDVRQAIASAASTPKTKAIAVLPFGNISQEIESDYFSDGLTEELIVNLSKLNEIRVIPRSKSMQYKGSAKEVNVIGRELGTRYILSGNVRKFQDNLRISVELVDIDTEDQIWAETYKGKLEDVFDIQEQVSKQIVDSLMVKLTPTEQVALTKRSTVDTDAFDCYLRARDFLYRRTKNSLHFAIQLFQKAIEIDTRYAAAYAGLGEAYATLHYDYDTKEIWIDKAIESSLKALMYDSTVSEAYAALALAYFSKKSLQEAEAAALRAIDLGPNIFTGYWVLARIYHVENRDRECIDLLKKTIELNPDFHTAHGELRMVYERMGDMENYEKMKSTILELLPRYLEQHPDDARSHIYYAIELAQDGKAEEAKSQAKKALDLSPGDPLMLYNAACCYARLGDKLLAIESLKESVQAGLEDYEWIKTDTDFDDIRQEPGYIELMKGK